MTPVAAKHLLVVQNLLVAVKPLVADAATAVVNLTVDVSRKAATC